MPAHFDMDYAPSTAIIPANKKGVNVAADCWLHSLVISNFKSYRGRHVIGPFKHLTGVIGPNGAGKSNLLDAVAFVLGVQARQMRGSSLNSLIYRPSALDEETLSTPAPVEAFVTLVLGLREGEHLIQKRFSRRIHVQPSGSCITTVHLDDNTVSLSEYKAALEEHHILVKARSFLVFQVLSSLQGDVIEVAQKSPEELSTLFEQVSGAEALRDDILKLDLELKKLTADIKAQTLQRQRFEAQKQDLEKQVHEAEAYKSLEHELDTARSALVSFKLFTNEVETSRAQSVLEGASNKLSSLEVQREALQTQLRETDATLLKLRSTLTSLVEEQQSITRNAEAVEADVEGVKETVQFLENQKKDACKQLQQATSAKCNGVKKQEQLQQEINLIRSQLEVLETSSTSDCSEHAATTKLLPEEKSRYVALKQKAAAAASGLKLCSLAVESKRKLLNLQLVECEAEIEDLKTKLEEEKDELGRCSEYVSGLTQQVENERASLVVKEQELLDTQQQLEDQRRQHEQLVKSAMESRIKAAHNISQRQYRLQQLQDPKLIHELQHVFNTQNRLRVIGSVPDLCRPTSSKYNEAIHAALGQFWDCIVVDSFSTAKEAVQYLKSRKAAVREFASLDTLNAKTFSDDQLRKFLAQHHRQRPSTTLLAALDCVEYAPAHAALMQCVFRSTVIVDTLEEAQDLAFPDAPSSHPRKDASKLRLKIVTMNGEKLLKNGNIVVNTQRSVSATTSCIASDTPTKLGPMASPTSSEPSSWDELRHVETQLQHCALEIQTLERQTSELATHLLPRLRFNLDQKQKRLQLWISLREKAQEQIAAAENALRLRLEKRTALTTIEIPRCVEEYEQAQETIRNAEESLFLSQNRDNSLRTFKELRELEEDAVRRQREYVTKKSQLSSRRTKLESEAHHQETQLQKTEATIKALQKKIQSLEQRLESANKKLETLDTQKEKDLVDAAQRSLIGRLKETEAALNTATDALAQQRDALRVVQRNIAAVGLEKQETTAKLDKLSRQASDLLRTALLDRVPLPLDSAALRLYACAVGLTGCEGVSLKPLQKSQGRRRMSDTLNLPGTCSLLQLNSEALPRLQYNLVLSSKQLQEGNSLDPDGIRSIERQLEERVGSLRAELGKKHPNMKAADKFEHTAQETKALTNCLSELRVAKENVERQFLSLRRERGRRFMSCFSHAQTTVQDIYHRLTGGDGENVLGGHAFLDLADASSPIQQPAVLYNVIPPSKRFSNLRRLSGGEKTIAALALLFALHCYQPSPFFVLDEIDADLDPANITYLADFIRDVHYQIIIMSHSDRVFSQTDQLIGIYVDPAKESSASLSLDLSQYPRRLSTAA